MKHNQKGMLGIEGVLMLIIVGLLAFIGWYVWHTKQTTNATLNGAASQQISVKAKDPTLDWIKYSSASGKFSLKYPNNWFLPDNKVLCANDMLMLGGSQAAAGHCASDAIGEVIITSKDGDQTKNYQLSKTEYPNVSISEVTVDGVKGQKITGTFHQAADTAGLGIADNTKVIAYLFVTGGKTYVALYQQQPAMPDVANDFQVMITRTLKFNS
jgi:hypothetical protein